MHRQGIGGGWEPHMHAGRADDGAADLRGGIVKARSQRVANDVDVAERYRNARRQACLRGTSSAERMCHGGSVDDARHKACKIGYADQLRRFAVVAAADGVLLRERYI